MKKLENIRKFTDFTGQEEMNPDFMGENKKGNPLNQGDLKYTPTTIGKLEP
jgi:hypothetical protein